MIMSNTTEQQPQSLVVSNSQKPGIQSSEFKVIIGIFLMIMIGGSAFLWFDKITNAQWVDLMKWIGVSAMGFYTAQRGYIKGKPPQKG
jgi:hypothetical protein